MNLEKLLHFSVPMHFSFGKILMVVLLLFVPLLVFSSAWICHLPLVDWNMAKHGLFSEQEEGSEE